MAYKHGNFVWFELVSSDIAKGKAFYGEVLGWKTSPMQMGDTEYTMLMQDGAPQGGFMEPQMEGVPPHWTSYVSVPDVDAAAATAAKLGGKVIVDAFDVPTIGRMALVADPQGAAFFLFKGDGSDDQSATAFPWVELWAKDAKKVLPFYEKVVGWTVKEMSMGPMQYYVFERDGRSCAGALTSPVAEAPAMWLPYVEVPDTDATIGRVQKAGGKVQQPPTDIPDIGRFAVFTDNVGAALAVIKSAPRPGK